METVWKPMENQLIQVSMIKVPSNTRFTSMTDFHFVPGQKLGSGSFGTVRLARHRNTCRMYAVKQISSLPSEADAKMVEREIQLHSQLDHPHLIRLWDTLVQEETIYMIMEYAEQGNLFYHQNLTTTFSEAESFKFFTQTLQAVGYMHRHNIIHRDLKPENLLLDQYFNIKVCDFGWAALDINQKRSTFCGTYEYMAPEMLFQGEYDHRVDIWALGVLLYELLHGHAPFKGKQAEDVQAAMVEGGYEVNPTLSEGVRSLISSILQIDPEKRIRIDDIFLHPWVQLMETQINGLLQLEKVHNPKQIHQKISKMAVVRQQHSNLKVSDHRKNASMNSIAQTASSNLMEAAGTEKSSQKVHHSHEKENEHRSRAEKVSPKEESKRPPQSGILRKAKMEGVRTQMKESQMHRFLEKAQGKKSVKINKELGSFEREPSELHGHSLKKPKSKNNVSEVEIILAEKYPIRFNTEAFDRDDWEPTSKLKKSHINSKILHYSRSALRFQKARIDLKF